MIYIWNNMRKRGWVSSLGSDICNICLSDEVSTRLDRLTLCKKCADSVRELWNEAEIKKL